MEISFRTAVPNFHEQLIHTNITHIYSSCFRNFRIILNWNETVFKRELILLPVKFYSLKVKKFEQLNELQSFYHL